MESASPVSVTDESTLAAVLDPPWPGVDDPGWVDVRCCGSLGGELCNKLLLRITAEPTVDGLRKAVKIGLDMKCRRCKEINYRVIVI